jgi:Chaperone of endosialidase
MKRNMTTPSLAISIGRSRSRLALLLIPLVFACFMLSPTARAVLPPPDGGYPNNNTAEGSGALFSLTTGTDNTAIGFDALYSFQGSWNTAVGSQALFSNTTGNQNTATGFQALFNNSTGFNNTASGYAALASNTTGGSNTATGFGALSRNTTGDYNTASGEQALADNTTGSFNTASGYVALGANRTGHDNLANGVGALFLNTTGSYNTANGSGATSYFTGALTKNTTGSRNTATGNQALRRNQTGNGNTAEGFQALANNTGSFNIAVGFTAGANLTTGSDNIHICHPGVAGESNTMRIGGGKQTATFITGIRGVTTRMANAIPVLIDSAGQLGTMSSSKRFKQEIKPMDKASEAILALKPVTFHYKSDKTGTPQFGLIAEEVAAVNPDLVVRDKDGEIYTVRYDQVNAMLLNEFLKEHRKVEEQEKTIAQLKQNFQCRLAEQQKQIEALAAGLQKVSAQLELNKPAPQVAENNQ